VYPVDGSHQGVAPQRDFLILVRMADDPGADEAPAFEPLMVLARKASGTPHPLSLSAWKADGGTMGIAQEGESDWVVTTKIGDTPISIIVIGVFAG
jgi:hypothetical protein